MFPGGLGPRLKQSESEKVPVFEEPTMGYKKEDIPLFEDASKSVNQYAEDDIDEDPFRGYGNNYLDHLEEGDEEMFKRSSDPSFWAARGKRDVGDFFAARLLSNKSSSVSS